MTLLQSPQNGDKMLEVEEHPQRVIESIKISSAEYRLIQAIRAIRKKSIVIMDVGGDGVPRSFRAIEACVISLVDYK